MKSRLKPISLLIAIGIPLSIPVAKAELITLPAVPVTVADCRPGDHWGRVNGIARCVPDQPPAPVDTCNNHGLYTTNQGGGSTFVPGVGTCYNAAPTGPVCKYANGNPYYMVVVGPGNCNGADSGCSGTGIGVAWGTSGFGVFNNTDYLPGGALNNLDPDNLQRTRAWIDATLSSWGYYKGAYRGGNIGNGNYDSSEWYEVCRY
ncbi:hypothetical protein [Cupriavidus sp. D39]|uniref:hypothetical protein n=1 Tax=Cupriavidus sp. D39 TaxID=2997877 RepID=UPI00226E8FBD|nr:hypothetical protein [Cupriavidus sp. D39]MCY0853656.1 hypothetical protein [Cupriavidus sp. D39]